MCSLNCFSGCSLLTGKFETPNLSANLEGLVSANLSVAWLLFVTDSYLHAIVHALSSGLHVVFAWSIYFFSVCLFILRERARECACVSREGQRERERDRIPSRLCAVIAEPDMGLDPMNHEIMTWAETNSGMLNCLSHQGTPGVLVHTYTYPLIIFKIQGFQETLSPSQARSGFLLCVPQIAPWLRLCLWCKCSLCKQRTILNYLKVFQSLFFLNP